MYDLPNYDTWKTRFSEQNEQRAQEAADAVHERLIRVLAALPPSVVRRASSEVLLDEINGPALYEVSLLLGVYSASLDPDSLSDDLATWLELIALRLRRGTPPPSA